MDEVRELAVIAARAMKDDALHKDEALAKVREALYPPLPVPDPEAAFRAAIPDAAKAPDHAAAAAILYEAASEGVDCPLNRWENEPPPAPVIWRDDDSGPDRPPEDAPPRRGEVAVLTGDSGLGKSYVTVRAALTAADGGGIACGFRVAGGVAFLISYEDVPGEMWRRAARLREADGSRARIPDSLRIVPNPPPLFEPDPEVRGWVRPCADWSRIFGAIRARRPVLVVVDPASEALLGLVGNDPGPVRAFLEALRAEAEAGNFGVLVVAHSTKAARREARMGGADREGAISGSSAWQDKARTVLYMWEDLSGGGDRIVEVLKANYGRREWGVRLNEVETASGRFGGLAFGAHLDRDGVRAAR